MQRIVSILVLPVLALAAAWSIRLARADAAFRTGTPEGVRRAVELVPNNTSYLAFSALQAEYDGRDSSGTLQRIASLNPKSSAPRIRLGLTAEQKGDFAEAERYLLDANAVDRQFEPRWTLANFYFRREREPEFWNWIRSALEVSYGDRTPAFDLCWRMSSDPLKILARGIPDRTDVSDAYLQYVIGRHTESISPAAARASDRHLLLVATDTLLEANRNVEAVEVWRQLGRDQPQGVTSSHFEGTSTGRGFDWRFTQSEGVTHQQLDGRRGHRIRFTGKQSEAVQLLSQYMGGLRAGTRYRLMVRIEGAPPGLEWRIGGQPVTSEFFALSEVAQLELWYVRPRGESRAESTFDIREVSASALQ